MQSAARRFSSAAPASQRHSLRRGWPARGTFTMASTLGLATPIVVDEAAAPAAPPAAPQRPAVGQQLLSVAPMMDWTDVHYRQMARIISRHTWLWTEMVVDKTIIHTPQLDRFLWFPPEQHPIVCQMGGSDPASLLLAARKVAEYGYDEINLNCGCPSDKVAGAGCFGASMMLQPSLVARCMSAIAEGCAGTPVTVKCRLGVDEVDSYEALHTFVSTVAANSPVRHFIIHARKCMLNGLSPTQNRTIPPLRHNWVFALAVDLPHLTFSLNGGVQSAVEARAALDHTAPPRDAGDGPAGAAAIRAAAGAAAATAATAAAATAAAAANSSVSISSVQPDGAAAAEEAAAPSGAGGRLEGVMIGRAAYNEPWRCLAQADTLVFGAERDGARSRRDVLEQYARYADSQIGRWLVKADGSCQPNVRALFKPLLGLFHGEPRSKQWKARVDELLQHSPASVAWVLENSLPLLSDAVLDSPPGAMPQPMISNALLPPLLPRYVRPGAPGAASAAAAPAAAAPAPAAVSEPSPAATVVPVAAAVVVAAAAGEHVQQPSPPVDHDMLAGGTAGGTAAECSTVEDAMVVDSTILAPAEAASTAGVAEPAFASSSKPAEAEASPAAWGAALPPPPAWSDRAGSGEAINKRGGKRERGGSSRQQQGARGGAGAQGGRASVDGAAGTPAVVAVVVVRGAEDGLAGSRQAAGALDVQLVCAQ